MRKIERLNLKVVVHQINRPTTSQLNIPDDPNCGKVNGRHTPKKTEWE